MNIAVVVAAVLITAAAVAGTFRDAKRRARHDAHVGLLVDLVNEIATHTLAIRRQHDDRSEQLINLVTVIAADVRHRGGAADAEIAASVARVRKVLDKALKRETEANGT